MALRKRGQLVAPFNFSLLTISWYNATIKDLFMYPQGEKSGVKNPKKDKHQH